MAHDSLLASLSSELSGLVQTASSFVVTVSGRPHRPASGLALGGDLVITADHVIERDRDLSITIGGTRHEATLAGRDPATDLAVLRVSGLDAAAAPIGEVPRAGSLGVSISRTASGTVSTGFGVITSVGGPLRTGRGVVLPAIVRTDAALRPGTAGGALVDVSGHLVGMTTPALMRGLPVAIPAKDASEVAARLASRQPLGRGYLGITVQAVTLAAAQRDAAGADRGLLIFGVAADGAAARAGLLVGDVLVRFEAKDVRSQDDLQDSLFAAAPGTEAHVTVLRGAKREDLIVTIAERPPA
jgi:S1-C subfamily serine protease